MVRRGCVDGSVEKRTMKPANLRDFDVLVIGECFVEWYCSGDITECYDYARDIGGADCYVAVTAAALGSNVA